MQHGARLLSPYQPIAIAGIACALLLVSMISTAPAALSATTPELFVSPSGLTGAADSSCTTAGYSVIDAAITAAPNNADIVVCAGIYNQAVVLDKAIHLRSESATIDALGHDVGIDLTASGATVVNFTVENATGEGILARGHAGKAISNVTISNDLLRDNDRGQHLAGYGKYKECEPGPKKAPGDCGAAIHLQFANHCLISSNVISANPGGGILLSDEFGPTADNVVEANVVSGNAYGGITLAGRNARAYAGGTEPNLGGVYGNRLINNDVIGNGANGRGGGILLASSVKGGAVYNNTITSNKSYGNGFAGVTVHSRAEGQDLNGNVISANTLSENNDLGDRVFRHHPDVKSTAVLIGSSGSPVSITVVHNAISGDAIGIWWTGPVSITGSANNTFSSIRVHLKQG